MKRLSSFFLAAVCLLTATTAHSTVAQNPPDGFEAIFNGNDLTGWYAVETYNPRKFAELSDSEQEAKRETARKTTDKHWRVENGEIVNDGHGPISHNGSQLSRF